MTSQAPGDRRATATTPSAMPDNDVCCAVFDPTPWDGVTHDWREKLFFTDDVRALLHVPIDMGSVVTRMMSQILDAQAMPDPKEFLILLHDSSPWKSEILMTVTKDVPGGSMTKLSGTFFAKVFDGPYQDAPKWIKATNALLASRGRKAISYYFHYAYCPKCSKKYGHNYCVVFAQLQ